MSSENNNNTSTFSDNSNSRAFYFNARDGWRVGNLLGTGAAPKAPGNQSQSSTVIPVVDLLSGMRETIQYHDLMVSDNDETTRTLSQLTKFREMFSAKRAHQKQLPNGDSAVAFDLCEYKPSPLAYMPSTVDALRSMYDTFVATRLEEQGVPVDHLADEPCRVAAGGPLQLAMKPSPYEANQDPLEGVPKVSSLSLKVDEDSVKLPSTLAAAKDEARKKKASLLPTVNICGASAAQALIANNTSQTVFCIGAQSTLADSIQHVLAAARRFNATETQLANLLLACNILASFTHDGFATQHGIINFTLHVAPSEKSSTESVFLKAIDVNASNIDLNWVVNSKGGSEDPNYSPDFLSGLVLAGSVEQREQSAIVPRSRKVFRTVNGDKIPNVDPLRKRFLGVVDAITRLKIDRPTSAWIWQLAGAIVNVLDISQYPSDNSNNNNNNEPSPTAFERLAGSLNVDEATLRGVIKNDVDRDQTARVLYRGLVRMLVRKINAVLNPDAIQTDVHLSVVSAIAPTLSPNDKIDLGKSKSAAASFSSSQSQQQQQGESIYNLAHHLFFEDITQIYMTRTHAENLSLQKEGCAVAEVCRAVLDSSDNYAVLKTLRAKNGLLTAFDTLEKSGTGGGVAGSTAVGGENGNNNNNNNNSQPQTSRGNVSVSGNNNNDNDDNNNQNQQQQQSALAKKDTNFYFKPEAEIEESFDPAKQQQRIAEKGRVQKLKPDLQKPPLSSMAMMAFVYACGVRVLSVEHNFQQSHPLEKVGDNISLLTISTTGTSIFWNWPPNDKSAWQFTIKEDLISCNFEKNGEITLTLRGTKSAASSPQSTAMTVRLQVLIRRENAPTNALYREPNFLGDAADAQALQRMMNLFARAILFNHPLATLDYAAPPTPQQQRKIMNNSSPAAATESAPTPSPRRANNTNDPASALFTPEFQRQIRSVFSSLPQCTTDVVRGTVDVPHSFGIRTYNLPRRSDVGNACLTLAAPSFTRLRSALTENTSGVVQEVLLLEEQALNGHLSYIALLRSELDSLLQKCLRPSKNPRTSQVDATSQLAVPWYSLQLIFPSTGQFDGLSCEQQLSFLPFVSLPSLRAIQPQLLRRFLPVDFSWVAKRYMHILPLAKRRRFRVLFNEFRAKAEKNGANNNNNNNNNVPMPAELIRGVEEMLLVANVGFRIGSVHALIDGPSLVKLEAVAQKSREQGLCLVQALLRWRLSFGMMTQRGTFVEAARAVDKVEADKVKRARQDALIQVRVLAERCSQLMAEENSERRDINDTMLVEWVALCAEARTEAEQRTERQLARKMLIEQRDDMKLGQTTKRRALDALARRIRDRIASNGERLDHMVMRCVVQNEGSRMRHAKMETVHRNLLNQEVRSLEDKAMLELQVRAKTERILSVRERISERAESKKKISYQKHEAERLAREQLTQQQEARTERAREEAMFDDIERKIAKNIEKELAERQRQQRDAVRQAHLEERKKHREALQQQSKITYRKTVVYEVHQDDKQIEAERKRERYNRLLWDAHEKERRAFEAAKNAEKKSEKAMVQGLLRAQTLLATPHVFVRGGDGKAHLADATGASASRARSSRSSHSGRARTPTASSSYNPQLDGFVMAGGKSTAHSLLPEEVWSNVIESMTAVGSSSLSHLDSSSRNNNTSGGGYSARTRNLLNQTPPATASHSSRRGHQQSSNSVADSTHRSVPRSMI